MRFKPTGIRILMILGAIVLILAILTANLPFLAQRFLDYRYGALLASRDIQFHISHVGKNRILVSDLKWGKDISVDLASLSYEFQGPGLPVIRDLILSGLTIQGAYDAGDGLVIDPVFRNGEMTLVSGSRGGSSANGIAIPSDWLPFLPDRIQVTGARLKLTVNQTVTVMPFNGTASIDKSNQQLVCDAVFYPFGQPVTLKTRIHSVAGVETFLLKADSFDFERLSRFLSMKRHPVFAGITDWSVEKLTHNTWQVAVSDMMLETPDKLVISHATARVLTEGRQISLLGEAGISHPMCSDLTAAGRVKVVLNPSGSGIREVTLTCETHPLKQLVVQHKDITARVEQPLAALSVQMKDQVIDGNLSLSFSRADIQKQGQTIRSGRGSVQSGIHGTVDTQSLTFDVISHLFRIDMQTPDSEVEIQRLDTNGTISMALANGLPGSPRIDLTSELVSGRVTVPGKNVAVQGIWAQIPVTYPHAGGEGQFSVEKLMIDNRAYLTGKGGILRIGKKEIGFDGIFQVPDSDAVAVSFKGTAGLSPDPRLHVTAETNRFKLSPYRFETLLPRTPFLLEYDLDVQVSGSAEWQDHHLTTKADLIIHEGSVSMPDQNLIVTGIQGRLAFNDLLAPASFPGQVLTIARIQAGDFNATDAAVRFTLEPGPSLVLENIWVNWAGGRVSTESIRIPSPDRSVALTLYCDRIQLDRLLAQMGGFKTQGSGSLNGRIPLVFKNGELSFDNAFLFSTPGQGGRIVIQNPEKLAAGIPMDSPRFSQLDLATEALKDFEYNWAKLTFDTQGETLTANMSLEGKPGRVLPFVYEKDVNSFVRVDTQSPGSRFQGIKLDVNLTLPFNRVVTFGNRIRKLLK
jgi:hypothetical protein